MLAKRMILLFFRNRTQVFFSMFAVLIIIGLYVLFLSNSMEMMLQTILGLPEGTNTGATMSSLVLGGIIAVTSVTSSMSALGRCVADREDATKDFFTSPVPRWKITIGYILGAAQIGAIMTFVALIGALLYINLNGNVSFGFQDYARLILTVFLSTLAANAMAFIVVVTAKNIHAYSALTSVIGTLIGFLMGIYIPIGQLPETVRWVVRLFPLSHAASMFRQTLANSQLNYLFSGVPIEYLEEFRLFFGVTFNYGEFYSNFWFSALVLLLTIIVFYGIGLILITRRKVFMN